MKCSDAKKYNLKKIGFFRFGEEVRADSGIEYSRETKYGVR